MIYNVNNLKRGLQSAEMNLGGVVHLNRTGICIISVIVFILLIYWISGNNGTSDSIVSKRINIRQLLITAIKAAQNGGIEVVKVKDRLKIDTKGKTKEGVNESVTTADYFSHCAMMETLRQNFPTVKIYSEEAKAPCPNDSPYDYSEAHVPELAGLKINEFVEEEDITVWIDPLDATKEYTEKKYQYVTTMVCIAVKGVPKVGIIHKPFSENPIEATSWAWVKVKTSADLEIRKTTDDDKIRFIVSMSHAGKIKDAINAKFKNAEIISAAGSGYKVLEVVHGAVDAYVHVTAIKKWDICAGDAILQAVGGQMTTKDNEQINYSDDNNVVNEKGLLATINKVDHNNYIAIF